MDLINHTPLPAELTVARLAATNERAGIVTAKATFVMAPPRLELERQQPVELVRAQVSTDLGELPSDFLPRNDARFEVILLGRAHGPDGARVRHCRVGMSLGSVRRELRVTGDRMWQDGADGLFITEPQAFSYMPLTWERAFGGACRIELAPGVSTVVTDPMNPAGRGFDPLRSFGPGAERLALPEGYPRTLESRLLPNLEAPDAPVKRPQDVPPPACWATLPTGSLLRVDVPLDPHQAEARMGQQPSGNDLDRAWFNACQDWVIDLPEAKASLVLEGMTEGASLTLALPELRVVADYAVGERSGVLPLKPMSLVVFAEERRITLTYRGVFRVDYEPMLSRTLRLRLEQGWYGGSWAHR